MTSKRQAAHGHCAICVEFTIESYRKFITAADCKYCRAYDQGRFDGRAEMVDAKVVGV